MALTSEEKSYLDQLRQDLVNRTGPQAKELAKTTYEVELTGVSAEDLAEYVDSQAVLGIDLNEIDTSGKSTGGKFTSSDMNAIAPGAIDVNELMQKFAPMSLVQARVTDLVETQSGNMTVINQVKINADIEDIMHDKVKSQGINLQMIIRASYTDSQEVANLDIKSRFLEE